MTRILSEVTLSIPSGNISKNINDTFTMTQQFATTGVAQQEAVTLYWQYDQGTSNWIDIPTSGATGLTADSGEQSGAVRLTDYSRTITCKSVGTFVIRAKGIGSSTKYSSNTPTVTVSGEPQIYYQDVSGNIAFARQTRKMIRIKPNRKK